MAGISMKWMNRLKIVTIILCALILAGTGVENAFAATPGSILSKWVSDNKVVLILHDTGTEDIHVQIGTTQCSDIQVTDGGSEPMQTLILVDNSESIAEKYRPVIHELLVNIIGSKGANETYTIATFTDRQSVLIENSGDYSAIKKTIDSITYDSHDAWLVPVLFDVLSGWQQDDHPAFRRIIVISDGASEERTGYTMEELNGLLKDYPCPIYSIGADHKNNDNKEDLNRLFALSRLTKGEGWLLADVSDSLEVASAISEEGRIQKVIVSPPPEICDGTERGIQVEAGGSKDQTTMVMPFQNLADLVEVPAEPEIESPEVTEAEPEIPIEETQAEPNSKTSMILPVAAIVCITGTIAAVVIIAVRRKNSKPAETEKGSQELDEDELTLGVNEDDDSTLKVGSDLTVDVFGSRTPKLILTDKNDPNQRFTAALKGTIMVGRPDANSKSVGSKIIIKDRSVSRSHCTFRCENGRLFLSDAGSKNGTIVNGKNISQETEVFDGNIITLGNMDLKVEIQR